jgi:AraC-like DNA-binding protein
MIDLEFETGLEPMADAFGLEKKSFGNGKVFDLTDKIGEGWITHFKAAPGLFISSIWFTPNVTLTYTFLSNKSFTLLFGIDCGDITITRNGKPTKHLTHMNHFECNNCRPLKITFPKGVHVCATLILLFDNYFISSSNKILNIPFSLSHIYNLKDTIYNTPDFTFVMEQTKWAARNGILPLFYYECKLGELISILIKNTEYHKYLNRNRRYHITWENEQKIMRIKELLDDNILNAPSMDSLAMSEAISTSKLHRCFKQYYKMTIFEYIHLEKMKRALLMLAADDLSIKNIANACGYESASKFTSAFKAIYQFTPSQYRKANNL